LLCRAFAIGTPALLADKSHLCAGLEVHGQPVAKLSQYSSLNAQSIHNDPSTLYTFQKGRIFQESNKIIIIFEGSRAWKRESLRVPKPRGRLWFNNATKKPSVFSCEHDYNIFDLWV
jgi:hypothetical protein